MIKIVQAYDRAPFAEVQSDDADALEIKLEAARRAFLDRDGWLAPHERIAVLRRLANLLGGKVNHFARLIAREGAIAKGAWSNAAFARAFSSSKEFRYIRRMPVWRLAWPLASAASQSAS